jgi:outer membrane receptor protein involved in Fe transport
VPFENYGAPNLKPFMVPDYSNWDLNGVYKFKMVGFDAELIGTVNNLLNSKYIQDAEDYNASGQASQASVYYSLERRFTTTLKVRF